MKDKKTKILHIITGTKIGGAEVLLRDINRTTNKDLFDITILSLTPLGEIGEEVKKDGGNISSLNIGFKFNPTIFIKLFLFIKKYKPDIIHTHLFHAHVLGRIVGKVAGIPLIISTFHSDNFGGKMRERLLKYTDYYAKINVAVSEAVSERLVSNNISPEDKIRIIHNGIDLSGFPFRDFKSKREVRRRINLGEEDKLLVSVGRLNKVKGHSLLIESFKSVKEVYPNSKLVVIGGGEEESSLLNQISKMDLNESVFLLGRKSNVADYLNSADLFVSSSIHEGFGIAIAEAMACGLLVVATDVGGVSELIENGKTGFLVDPGNPKALAEKIKKILSLAPAGREQMGRAARVVVQEKFSLEKMVNEYQKLYKELTHERKRNKTTDPLAS